MNSFSALQLEDLRRVFLVALVAHRPEEVPCRPREQPPRTPRQSPRNEADTDALQRSTANVRSGG